MTQLEQPLQSSVQEVPSLKQGRRRRRAVDRLWLFVLPAAALYLFVVVWPTMQGVALSVTDWDGISPTRSFVGIKNFVSIFTDPQSFAATWRTLLIAVVITVAQNGLGLLLALGVNTKIKSRFVLRVLLFAPAVIIPVASAYIWKYLFAPDGTIDAALSFFGVTQSPDFLGDSRLAIWSVCVVAVWQGMGYSMVIFLAGLQGIPEETIEAAHLDGAGAFRRFWGIIRPELAPALTINLMLTIINGLKIFDQVWVLTNGGPGGSTQTITTLLYQNTFQYGQFGYGAAMAVILTILVAIISGFQYIGLRRQNGS